MLALCHNMHSLQVYEALPAMVLSVTTPAIAPGPNCLVESGEGVLMEDRR